MSGRSLGKPLNEWADHLETLEWSAMILDKDWTLVWISDQLKQFVGATDEDELGYGLHIVEAFTQASWMNTVSAESQAKLFLELAPFVMEDLAGRGVKPEDILPEHFQSLLQEVAPAEVPYVYSTSFVYQDPTNNDLPDYTVNACMIRLHDASGNLFGSLLIFFMGIRPNLLTLLARGDEAMYERMARLVEPRSHQAAILFCDMHESVRVSRRLPSSGYFKLVRDLWTGIDKAIAEQKGIVGKHAGDGASAFFLVEDVGSPSAAAEAALRASRLVHEVSEKVFREVMDSECLMKVGVHWGGSLYMGQLIPGGRLDVTALGDEVNEAARIQESAAPGQTIVSKELFERLDPADASRLGLDVEKLRFLPVAELDSATDKAAADVGTKPVAEFN